MARKIYLRSNPCFVTSRVESGLPLVPASHMNVIVEGIIAKAKKLYPVKLSSYLFMANHFHMSFVPLDPEDASRFVKYIKAESAHAINRLLNKRQQTVWCKGFDSPVILDAEKAIETMAYAYANPAKANLVDSIDKYPGVSSWKMFISGTNSKLCKKVSRDALFPLPSPSLGIGEQQKLAKALRIKGESISLTIEPEACFECFKEEIDPATARDLVIERVRELESEARDTRDAAKRSVIGELRLRTQSMAKKFKSKTFGKRMICLGSLKAHRVKFLKYYFALCEEARKIYQSWKVGDLSLSIPSGLFPPRIPCLSCRLEL